MAISSQDNEAGFTLVEILCVLALLGLTAGLVVLNLPKPPPPFRVEVTKTTQLLNLAARESIIDGKMRGIDLTTSGLEIFKYDGEWQQEAESNFTHVFGLDVTVEQQPIDIEERTKKKDRAKKDRADETLPPLIFFDPTGNVTPFTISIRGESETFRLEPDLRGRIIAETTP